jgi:gluconate 5-dehydrogenase
MTTRTKGIFDLSGKTALITGGGSGIGLAIATGMAVSGAKVILTGRKEAKLQTARDEIGDQAFAVPFDITDLGRVPRFAADVTTRFGPVDILVNNAGVHLKKPVEEISDAQFQAVLTTHVNAAFALSREFSHSMLARGEGSILFIASMASLFGFPHVSAYAAAKSAHLGLVRSLAVEFGSRGVRVNAVAPGWIHSEMMHRAVSADPERQAKILGRTPLGEFGNPEDVAAAAVFLSSPAAKFITGVCLPVDGGASIGF